MICNKPTKYIVASSLIGLVLLPSQTMSASMNAKVQRMLVQPGLYGGCAATFTVDPQTIDASCDANWLSFDCDGSVRSKSDSALQWNAVQLAAVTDRDVFVIFQGSPKINGKCRATRIDIKPAP